MEWFLDTDSTLPSVRDSYVMVKRHSAPGLLEASRREPGPIGILRKSERQHTEVASSIYGGHTPWGNGLRNGMLRSHKLCSWRPVQAKEMLWLGWQTWKNGAEVAFQKARQLHAQPVLLPTLQHVLVSNPGDPPTQIHLRVCVLRNRLETMAAPAAGTISYKTRLGYQVPLSQTLPMLPSKITENDALYLWRESVQASHFNKYTWVHAMWILHVEKLTGTPKAPKMRCSHCSLLPTMGSSVYSPPLFRNRA